MSGRRSPSDFAGPFAMRRRGRGSPGARKGSPAVAAHDVQFMLVDHPSPRQRRDVPDEHWAVAHRRRARVRLSPFGSDCDSRAHGVIVATPRASRSSRVSRRFVSKAQLDGCGMREEAHCARDERLTMLRAPVVRSSRSGSPGSTRTLELGGEDDRKGVSIACVQRSPNGPAGRCALMAVTVTEGSAAVSNPTVTGPVTAACSRCARRPGTGQRHPHPRPFGGVSNLRSSSTPTTSRRSSSARAPRPPSSAIRPRPHGTRRASGPRGRA